VGSIPTASTKLRRADSSLIANDRAAVLFDFGGTLDADGLPWKERVYRLFRDEGAVMAPDRFDPAFYAADDALVGTLPVTTSFRATVERLAAGVAATLELPDPDIAARVAARFLSDSLRTLEGNTPLLRELSRRYRLGIVSNFYGNLAQVCEDAGIRRLFGVLVDSAEVGCTKPAPRRRRPSSAILCRGTWRARAPSACATSGSSAPRRPRRLRAAETIDRFARFASWRRFCCERVVRRRHHRRG